MKSIVAINTDIPTIEKIDYLSVESLRDYDIAIFHPRFPYLDRIEFSGGGSCISITAAASLAKAMSHWSNELRCAIEAGKTVFVILGEYKEDDAANNYKSIKNRTTYNTNKINNYSVIPAKLNVRNGSGRKIIVHDKIYHNIYSSIKDLFTYKCIIEPQPNVRKIFSANDGAIIGCVVTNEKCSGSLVLLPHFDFDADELYIINEVGEAEWTDEAIKLSKALVGQLVAIDKLLKVSAEHSPPPAWVEEMETPKVVIALDCIISDIEGQIEKLRKRRDEQTQSRAEMLEYSHLLYETGKALEHAIEKALRLLGYSVESLRIGDLEIDHVIISPTGKRMIGESEGKDTSAIDISKFRQLESNIGEDFERDEIDEPAKGLLFGNGLRLTAPSERKEQFTAKCLTNSHRLRSALIRTADLYRVSVYLLDHPEDEAFKAACRSVIEETEGGIVEFPAPS